MDTSDILIYQNNQGDIKLDVRLEKETGWLTQDHMAALFGKLNEEVVCRNFRLTTHKALLKEKRKKYR